MRKHANIFTAVTISKLFAWDLAETSPSALVFRRINAGQRLHQMLSVTPSYHRDPIINTCSPPKLAPARGLPWERLQPQDITVKRLEMQDMLCSTMPRRKTNTQATRMTVHTPDHVELFATPRLSGSSSTASWGAPPCRGCCSAGMVTTVRDFCWLPGSRRQPMSPGRSVRSLEMGRGSM